MPPQAVVAVVWSQLAVLVNHGSSVQFSNTYGGIFLCKLPEDDIVRSCMGICMEFGKPIECDTWKQLLIPFLGGLG
jgi:hypothetical protein